MRGGERAARGVGAADHEGDAVERRHHRVRARILLHLAREARLQATEDPIADCQLQIGDLLAHAALTELVRPLASGAQNSTDLAARIRTLPDDDRVEEGE